MKYLCFIYTIFILLQSSITEAMKPYHPTTQSLVYHFQGGRGGTYRADAYTDARKKDAPPQSILRKKSGQLLIHSKPKTVSFAPLSKDEHFLRFLQNIDLTTKGLQKSFESISDISYQKIPEATCVLNDKKLKELKDIVKNTIKSCSNDIALRSYMFDLTYHIDLLNKLADAYNKIPTNHHT